MKKNTISVINANENNLKNLSVDIPKDKLIVITGVSGSGKSSLAFGVLYNEGRRRYVDSLSNYARQFLGGTKRPDVETIEGLSPSIAIDQKTTSNNPRSTVGTITEIYDFYRLLFARIGKAYCLNHGIEISSRTTTSLVEQVMNEHTGNHINILSPVVKGEKGTHADLLDTLRKQGYVRVKVNNEIKRLDEEITLKKTKAHTISIVVDRVQVESENKNRIYEAISKSSEYSDGSVVIENLKTGEEKLFSLKLSCPKGDFSIDKIEPRMFSFNSPHGACEECKGLGTKLSPSWERIINPELRIIEGGIKFLTKQTGIEWARFEALAKEFKIDITKYPNQLTKKQIDGLMNGTDYEVNYTIPLKGSPFPVTGRIEGLGERILRRQKETTSEAARDFYSNFLTESKCQACNGDRLKKEALSVLVDKKNIMDVTRMSIVDAKKWIENLKLDPVEAEISQLVIIEIISRLEFLINVGLGYLTMDRIAGTLSGGESQRIRLASQLGSKLTGVLYVLDEPSIGLHQKDNIKLINSLKSIRDLGNTVIVVEHDEEMMEEADHIIDIGPNAGINGGEVVAQGTPAQLRKSSSLTGQYMSGKEFIPVPKQRRKPNGKTIQVVGAQENNLKNIDVTFPLGVMIVVSGVSGSGKSTLINEILYKAVHNQLTRTDSYLEPGKHLKINGLENIDKVIQITQDPIGSSPRSNPATYVGVFDDIRDLFANTMESKVRGFAKGRFSFNVPGGRCEKCSGDGTLKVSMHFLPDVYVTCDECDGRRYNEETLEVMYKGKNINDVLNMSIDDSLEFFTNIPKIKRKLQLLVDVGLGYLRLGQPSNTLSGGESQRVKLAKHLQKKSTGRTLYLLDEPTTGLHHHDIKRLIAVLNRLIQGGDTMIIIEHNLDVIKQADYIIDMGPEGGDGGGMIVAKGAPEQVAKSKKTATGPYLYEALNKWK